MFSLVAPGEISVFYVAVISLNVLVGCIAMPNMMSVCGVSRKEFDSRFGMMGGNFVKRLCTMAWAVTGLAAAGYYLGRGVHPDQIYGRLARDFLPAAFPGLLGLFLAGVLASVMSTCDAMMINSAALFTGNVYRPVRPDRSERHYVWVGRATSGAVVAGGLLVAYALPDVVRGIEILWCIIPMAGVALWLGLAWRRMTVAGAWAAVVTGFAVWGLTETAPCVRWLADQPVNGWLGLVPAAPGAAGAPLRLSLPCQQVMYLAAASVAGVAVSWLTRPVAAERLDRFYALLRTPVRPGEVLTSPCTLPEGVTPAPRRNLIPSRTLELPVPSWTSLTGFAVGWLIVAVMIAGFYCLTQTR
jgi:Na+/proline symporter